MYNKEIEEYKPCFFEIIKNKLFVEVEGYYSVDIDKKNIVICYKGTDDTIDRSIKVYMEGCFLKQLQGFNDSADISASLGKDCVDLNIKINKEHIENYNKSYKVKLLDKHRNMEEIKMTIKT